MSAKVADAPPAWRLSGDVGGDSRKRQNTTNPIAHRVVSTPIRLPSRAPANDVAKTSASSTIAPSGPGIPVTAASDAPPRPTLNPFQPIIAEASTRLSTSLDRGDR